MPITTWVWLIDNQGRFEEAIKEYQTAIKLKPDYAKAYNNLGTAYYDRGRLDEAIKEYQTAIKLQPDYADAHRNLALAYQAKSRRTTQGLK